MKWSKDKIISDLQKLTDATITTEQHPQGEGYCRDIFLDPNDENGDGISIVGFNLDDISDVDNPTEDIEYVEVRNFNSDSDGGLSKSASKKIRLQYFIVLDYFNEQKVDIVDSLKDYF